MFAIYNKGSVGFRSTVDNLYSLNNIENIQASSDFGTVSCGSKTHQVFKDVKTNSISGGSGVLTWDDKIQAIIEIKNFEVTQN